MKIKNLISLLLLLISAVTVKAFLTTKFPGWDALTENSQSILIVQCTKSPVRMQITNGVVTMNPTRGVVKSDVEIVSTLKGLSSPYGTPVNLTSEYWPYQGERYLLFANVYDGSNCQALDLYRVIPLGHFFETNVLTDKPLRDQIHLLLQYRLSNLNTELKNNQEEKDRLEQALQQ